MHAVTVGLIFLDDEIFEAKVFLGSLTKTLTVQTWNCALTVGGFLGTPLPRCWLLNR